MDDEYGNGYNPDNRRYMLRGDIHKLVYRDKIVVDEDGDRSVRFGDQLKEI